jgi:hypothetical protein
MIAENGIFYETSPIELTDRCAGYGSNGLTVGIRQRSKFSYGLREGRMAANEANLPIVQNARVF